MAGYDELMEIMARRASHRKYLPDPVPREDIEKMAAAARLAPSAHNLQPWKLLALTGRDLIGKIAGAAAGKYGDLVRRLPEEAREEPAKFGFFVRHFGEAPLVFAVLSRRSETDWGRLERLHGVAAPRPEGFDPDCLGVGAFVQNLLLAAEALGYGACWVAAPVMYAQAEVEKLLGVAPPWRLVSVVPVGRRTRDRYPAPKKDVSEILTVSP